jgi:hypothetical protein
MPGATSQRGKEKAKERGDGRKKDDAGGDVMRAPPGSDPVWVW